MVAVLLLRMLSNITVVVLQYGEANLFVQMVSLLLIPKGVDAEICQRDYLLCGQFFATH